MIRLDAKRMARRVCKRLEVEIRIAIKARPTDDGLYSLQQGWRSGLAGCAASCFAYGMTEDEIVQAVKASIEGWKAAEAHANKKPPSEQN